MTGRRARRPLARARSAGAAAAVAVLLCLILVPGATGQVVEGTVTDADYDRPIGDAPVRIVDTLSVTVDSSTTDDAGRFRLVAPRPGPYILFVEIEGYLSYSDFTTLAAGDTVRRDIEMPLVSARAARVMHEVIEREAAFQLPWEELCGEPVRPWEAGVLVGVARDRSTLDPVGRAVIHVEPLEDVDPGAQAPPAGTAPESEPWPRSRVATPTGAFWFCNVPVGRARIVARAEGFATDTSYATIRAGTISWYDALLPRP